MFTTFTNTTLTKPLEPSNLVTRGESFRQKLVITYYNEELNILREGKYTLQSFILYQSSDLITIRVKSNNKFENKQSAKDIIQLFKIVKNIVTKVQDTK